MTIKSATLKTGLAAVALTALGLVAAAPASAHTNNMYTYMFADDLAGIATYSKTNGTTAFLPATRPEVQEYVIGLEVAGERGTILGYRGGETGYLAEWNHTSGQIGSEIPLSFVGVDGATNYYPTGLDTLNDGRTVTLVRYNIGDVIHWVVASVNHGNGELRVLTDITAAVSIGTVVGYEAFSLATEPASGITYVFLQGIEDEEPYFLPVTIATNTVGSPTSFENEFFIEGELGGADFDADGSLYVNFDNYDAEGGRDLQLLKLGAPSTWVSGAPTVISTAPAESTHFIDELALTIEHTALAATGSEVPILAIALVGTLAVLAGGVTVMVTRRRSEAGTV